ncbi:MAG TPA: hypothetical protein VMD30_09680, partial [Tepidisphaeraceae bacterium]|nr:hypothetical protein [Tepidisphaeraceae bacterium]
QQADTDRVMGDAGLDYPPLRLCVMTLWCLHLENTYNGLDQWPGPWQIRPARFGPTEDIAEPLLHLNSACEAASAVLMALLVGVWVYRGGRPNLYPQKGFRARLNHFFIGGKENLPAPAPLPADASLPRKVTYYAAKWTQNWRRQLVPWKPVRLCDADGLLLFPIALYALVRGAAVVLSPMPAPPPAIAWWDRPSIAPTQQGSQTQYQATFAPVVDPQGAPTQWWIEWGTSDQYGHSSPVGDAGSGSGPQNLSVTVTGLPGNATIHYRLTARNDQQSMGDRSAANLGRGTTHTDDATLVTNDKITPPMPDTDIFGSVWPTWQLWVELLVFFAAMAWALSIMPPAHRAWACGLVAALFLWFDPAILVDAHMWPQWDMWTLPPFLATALLASLDWWFCAGLVLAFGSFFKGQILFAAPVLIMWPLLSLRIGKVVRMLAGYLLMSGIIVSPWFVWNPARIGPVDWNSGPVRFVECMAAACAVALALSFYRKPVYRRMAELWSDLGMNDLHRRFPFWRKTAHGQITLPGSPPPAAPPTPAAPSPAPPPRTGTTTSLTDLVVFCALLMAGILTVTFLLLLRWPSGADISSRTFGPLLLLAVLIPPWFLRRRSQGVWAAMMIGLSIWLCAWMYHGDWSWKTVGFEFGTKKFADRMAMSPGFNASFPQILSEKFGWGVDDPAMTLRLPNLAAELHLATPDSNGVYSGWVHDYGLDGTPTDLTMKTVLISVYVVMTLLCGIAASLQSRRNDPKLLAALTATWALFPNFLTQMTSRYHMWGSAMASSLIGVAAVLELLQVALGLLGAWMVFAQLVRYDPAHSPHLYEIFGTMYPDFGWIMLLSSLIFLAIALTPGGRARSQELDLAR